MTIPSPRLDPRFSVCDRLIFGHRPSDYHPNFRWGYSGDENGHGLGDSLKEYSQSEVKKKI